MKLTKVYMDIDNRKIGVRGGKEKTMWYARIDLWFVGYRIS